MQRDSFGSKKMYNDRIKHFMVYASLDASEITLEMKLIKYFDDAKNLKNDNGEDRYRATSFRSWLSVFCKFWTFCRYKDLKTADTVAQKYIDQSMNMKQKASDVLSIGGLQTGPDGQQLRKRKFQEEAEQRTSSSRTATATVYNISFTNCKNTNFQMPDKLTE
jgi:hypothetical protein